MLHIVMAENEIPEIVEETRAKTAEEYEIVLGRRQVASVLFVATVALVTLSSLAYLAGKGQIPEDVVVLPAAPAPAPPLFITPSSTKIPVADLIRASEPPLFANPQVNATYLQMGAVERGIAEIFAEGLRRRGLKSFVAPGPNDKIFRVLIGPLKDPAEYKTVKDRVDAIGLSTFAKKYVN